jgi:spore germination protein YaaH
VVLVLLNAAGSRADAPPDGEVRAEDHRSIHELETLRHRALPDAARRVDPPAPITPLLRSSGLLTHEVHGYHPWWMGTSYTTYDWSLLSTIAFFSLELDGTGAIVDDHGWPWPTLVATAHENGVRVLVTATLFSTSEISVLLADPARRQVAVTNLVAEVQSAGADGINLDLEGVPGARKEDLVAFVGELEAALDSALPAPYLSVATPAVDWDNAFDYDELAFRCDHLMVMAYDYHWSGSAFTGPVAPLAGWGTYNVSWTVQDYQTWGTPPGKMLLGVPYYGYRWETVSGEPGAATTSSGVARTYTQAAADAELHGFLWDVPSSTPWYRYEDPGWRQGWYDDDSSLAAKYTLVLDEGLAGVGIWALGYDGTRPELWTALAAAFTDAIGVPGPVAVVSQGPTLRLAGRNPFRVQVDLVFSLARRGPAKLTVHDVAGRRVRTLVHGHLPAGPAPARWNGATDAGRGAAAGTYFVRLETENAVRTLRVVRIP